MHYDLKCVSFSLFYSLKLVSREVLTTMRVKWKVLCKLFLNIPQIVLVVDINRSFVVLLDLNTMIKWALANVGKISCGQNCFEI